MENTFSKYHFLKIVFHINILLPFSTVLSQPSIPSSNKSSIGQLDLWAQSHSNLIEICFSLITLIATLSLLGVTFWYAKTTKRQAEISEEIFEIDRKARLFASIEKQANTSNNLVISIQNIGKIPIRVNTLEITLKGSGEIKTKNTLTHKASNSWILPHSAITFSDELLSTIWEIGKTDYIEIGCSFFSIYSSLEQKKAQEHTSKWKVDHQKKEVVFI